MALSLSKEMLAIVENGFNLVKRHKIAIETEWQKLAFHLQQSQWVKADELDEVIAVFSEYIFDHQHNCAEELLQDLKRAKDQLKEPLSVNHIIFVTMLMENAVHKAINEERKQTFQDHQAVQYLFSQINEVLFLYPFENDINFNAVLEQLTLSRQFPIEWIAHVHQRPDGLVIQRIISSQKFQSPPGAITQCKYSTIFELSESLMKLLSSESDEKQHILPLPWNEDTLLFCIKGQETAYFMSLIGFTFHLLQKKDRAIEISRQGQQWKDSVILFNEWIIRSRNLNAAIKNITTGFVKYLPFERCALFSYSPTDHSIFGLCGHQFDTKAVQSIRDKSDNIPFIYKRLKNLYPLEKNLLNLQPIYTSKAYDGFPPEYVEQFQLNSLVITPIYVLSEGQLIGAAILDCGPGQNFKLNRDTFNALMKFGQIAGELLYKISKEKQNNFLSDSSSFHLSPREIDVLKLMADGESTSDIAQILNLSEYTVRDYVSAIMQKMKARNRTEAATRAIRCGII